jgi:hypothetical protein
MSLRPHLSPTLPPRQAVLGVTSGEDGDARLRATQTDVVDAPCFTALMCQDCGRWLNATDREATRMQVITIGSDIAKRVFQAHGVDEAGKAVLRRAEVLAFFRGLSPCLVGIEACGTAHHWAREIHALGHEVRLMPASYVKAYVKRGKTDTADAEAICEAVTRPTMGFVPVKTPEQQAALMLHRTRTCWSGSGPCW